VRPIRVDGGEVRPRGGLDDRDHRSYPRQDHSDACGPFRQGEGTPRGLTIDRGSSERIAMEGRWLRLIDGRWAEF
jgi:hypothetical protein